MQNPFSSYILENTEKGRIYLSFNIVVYIIGDRESASSHSKYGEIAVLEQARWREVWIDLEKFFLKVF